MANSCNSCTNHVEAMYRGHSVCLQNHVNSERKVLHCASFFDFNESKTALDLANNEKLELILKNIKVFLILKNNNLINSFTHKNRY